MRFRIRRVAMSLLFLAGYAAAPADQAEVKAASPTAPPPAAGAPPPPTAPAPPTPPVLTPPSAPAPVAKPPTPVPVTPALRERLAIKTLLANLREGPGTRARIVGVLKQGTRVEVLEEKEQWYRVRIEDGREGWIAESVTSAPAR